MGGKEKLGSSIVFKKTVAKCPTVKLNIAGIIVTCLLDTGSMVSTITESFFNKNLLPKLKLHKDKTWLQLRAANGLEIPYIGYVETDIFVPSINKTIKDRGILIVKDVPGSQRNDIPGLIGMNVISQCAELLQKQMGPSYLKQIECDETMVNWISAFKDCRKTDIKGFARVAGDRKVCIPANSVSIINVIGPSQKLSVEKTISIEPLSKNGELILVESVCTSSQNRYPVRVANIKSTDLWLEPNSRVGIIREVDCVYSRDTEIEFFRTDENEETLVLKHEVIGNQATESKMTPDISHLNCTKREKQMIKELFDKHQDVFTKDDTDLGFSTTVQHRINLTDDNPIAQPYRRIPPSQYTEA